MKREKLLNLVLNYECFYFVDCQSKKVPLKFWLIEKF